MTTTQTRAATQLPARQHDAHMTVWRLVRETRAGATFFRPATPHS